MSAGITSGRASRWSLVANSYVLLSAVLLLSGIWFLLQGGLRGAVLISAEKRWGVDLLKQRLVEMLDREAVAEHA